MAKIKAPEMSVIRFSNEDVIATSYYAAAADGGYDIYSGVMSAYDADQQGWYVNLGDKVLFVSADEFDEFNISLNSIYVQNGLYGLYNQNYTKGATYSEIKNQSSASATGQGATGGIPNPPPIPFPNFSN